MKRVKVYRLAIALVVFSCCAPKVSAVNGMGHPCTYHPLVGGVCNDRLVNEIRDAQKSEQEKLVKVNKLLELQADVNGAGHVDGATPLIAAAQGGHAHIVGLLLKARAGVSFKDESNLTALEYAQKGLAVEGRDVQRAHELIVKLLKGVADLPVDKKRKEG